MTIEIDFEIGDQVWFMGSQMEIRKLPIDKIEISIKDKTSITITPFNWVAVDIKKCFHSKAELIAHHTAIWEKSTGKGC